MSERILKALMQLFALISSPESNIFERRKVVETFLQKQLNKQLAKEYILIYEMYFNKYHENYQQQDKRKKRISSSSVRLLVICEKINGELTQKQKFTLLVLLLSFIKSGVGADEAVSEFERDFVELVARTLNFDDSEYWGISQFVMNAVDNIPELPNLLYVNNNPPEDGRARHLYCEGLVDSFVALHIASVDMYIGRYEGNRELFLNGQEMKAGDVYLLNYGCSIRNTQIKPVYYSDIVNCFYSNELSMPILFEAIDLEYEFESGHKGLHSINFEIFSGNIVGIMGGSGAGKSTLLSVLTGLNKPTCGNVLLNNTDIHEEAYKVEGLIGYVSQDDLLIEELTVFQNLYFNAKLCFGQYTDAEIREKTDDVLRDLGLFEIRDMKVGSPLNKRISGGQRKRLNIALELIRQPSVLFLDEPTSGLSSRDSDNIIDLLKDLSLKGKLVFVVIHQPSSDIFKMFDRLMVLDKGGYLIFNGNPLDAILHFKSLTQLANRDTIECSECGNVNPEQIFNIVESCVLDESGHATNTRRVTPLEWHDAFTPEEPVPDDERPEQPPSLCSIKRPSRLKQFIIYATRNIYSKVSDLQYVSVCLFEAPLLALLLSYIIRYYKVAQGTYSFEENENLPMFILVAVIIAIFIGLSVSAEEIIKDRKILKRESFLNLSRGSYLFSKTIVLFAISAVQAFLFVIVGNSIIGILEQTFTYWLVLFTAWTCANLMGLIISDTFKSVVTIYIIIPFIVIPQLMLSGVLLRFEKINPDIATPASIPWYGEIITARWAFEAIAVEQFTNNRYERIIYPYEKTMSFADYQRNYWIVEMRNKLDELRRNVENPDPATVKLISHEIERENRRQRQVKFMFNDMLESDGVSSHLLDRTAEYFDQLSRYYSALYTQTVQERDRLMTEIARVRPDSVINLKSRYHNQSLSSMLKNSGETYRIIEYKDRFLQNFHQIYKDPEHPFIKAHYYAPVKKLFGYYYPTLWVNVAVMWCFNVVFFIALYFRWLPNLLNVFRKRRK